MPEIQQRLGRPGALTQGDANEAQLRSRSKWLKNLPEMIIRLPTAVCHPQAVRARLRRLPCTRGLGRAADEQGRAGAGAGGGCACGAWSCCWVKRIGCHLYDG